MADLPLLTVSQLTQAIKLCLEGTFPRIWLQGEVSNFKVQSSGHLYFSLKDSQSQISAAMFRSDAVSLKVMPKDGDQVVVKGEINVYPPKGNYQIIVRELTPIGLGALLVKLEQLKQKLHSLGWFDSKHKKPLPKLPKRIGVVTSPTGAAIKDILNILKRRSDKFHLILNPVKVQGEGAAQEIAKAIEQFNQYDLADVLIVGRGGGSIEDLWAFNEEIVAAAIFNSRIPIISAVGHESDHCLSDYVADVRAPTPSAAAEIVIGERAHLLQQLSQWDHRLIQSIKHRIKHDRHQLLALSRQPLFCSSYSLLGIPIQRLDEMKTHLERSLIHLIKGKRWQLEGYRRHIQGLNPRLQIANFKRRFQECAKRIEHSLNHKMDFYKRFLVHSKTVIEAVNPKNLLKKGYSILFSEKEHSIINSIQQLEKQQKINILLSDGQSDAIVTEIYKQ